MDIALRVERARLLSSVLRYSKSWDESKHPRDDIGRFARSGELPKYVVRRTTNPESDLHRGWSAWGGQYAEDPWVLDEVDNALLGKGMDLYDIINGIDDEHTKETDGGWEIKSTPEAREAVADWLRDEMDLDVQRDPHTGLYGLRHHDGLSSYLLDSDRLEDAVKEAEESRQSGKHTWLTGGVTGLRPISYHATSDPEIFVFQVRDIGLQADS